MSLAPRISSRTRFNAARALWLALVLVAEMLNSFIPKMCE
jgi:hypothetical protein